MKKKGNELNVICADCVLSHAVSGCVCNDAVLRQIPDSLRSIARCIWRTQVLLSSQVAAYFIGIHSYSFVTGMF